MADTLTQEHRSWVMSRIRSGDTKAELILRSLLHRCGFRYSLRPKGLPGNPDLVLTKYKTVVFVNGCFWHRHRDPRCTISKVPKSNTPFWVKKFEYNATRDARNKRALVSAGWKVVVVWECEVLRDPGKALKRVLRLFRGHEPSELPHSYSKIDFRQVLHVAEERHKYILNKKAGSGGFVNDKSSKST